MKHIKGKLMMLAAGAVAMAAACSAGNVDNVVSCVEKTAKPLTLECTVSWELASNQFEHMLSSAQDSLKKSSVQITAAELRAMIAAAGIEIDEVTVTASKGSKIIGSYDDGFAAMLNGVVSLGANANDRVRITSYTGDGMRTFEMLGGNGRIPMTGEQRQAHEYIHVLQGSSALKELTQFLCKSGFGLVFINNWGGSTNGAYMQSKTGSFAILNRPEVGKTYDDELARIEKSWTDLDKGDFLKSFHELLDQWAEKRLDSAEGSGRVKALEALTFEADGLAKAQSAYRLIEEIHAYIAIPHSAIYGKSHIEGLLKEYVDTKIEEQLFPHVGSALDTVMRGYVALESAGITGSDAHIIMAGIAGGVMRPAQDYDEPFTFLKGDIGALIQQLGVPEPSEAEISAGWNRLAERNRQVTLDTVDALIGAAKQALGADSRIAAAAGKRKLLGFIPVNYCSNPTFSGTSLTDVEVTATEADGKYTTAISGTVKC